jgi:gluconate:H+ symporter, GntP family
MQQIEPSHQPNTLLSFTVILFPTILIAAKSMLLLSPDSAGVDSFTFKLISFTGDPVVALGAGTLLSLALVSRDQWNGVSSWLTQSVERAGIILAIIAAGGMFGEILQATGVGKQLSELLKDFSIVILLPFLITAIIKTAQGSSTVAIITAASLVAPLMSDLGFSSPAEVTLMTLSMGAGSMMVSHANDAYFWVISRFSELSTRETLSVYTTASIFMGITAQLIISLVYVFVQ